MDSICVKKELTKGFTVEIGCRDLTEEKVDAITNAANNQLAHGAGLAEAIVKKGGFEIEKESKEYVKKNGPVPDGQVAVTTSGSLPSKHVIHAVGPYYNSESKYQAIILLYDCIRNTLEKANELGCESLALPAISSGIFGFPIDLCAKTILEAIEEFAWTNRNNKDLHLKDVRILILDFDNYLKLSKELDSRSNFKRKEQVQKEDKSQDIVMKDDSIKQKNDEDKQEEDKKEEMKVDKMNLKDELDYDEPQFAIYIEAQQKYQQSLQEEADKVECHFCKQKIRLELIDQHETSDCSEREIKCRDCTLKIPYSLLEFHKPDCIGGIAPKQYDGFGFMGSSGASGSGGSMQGYNGARHCNKCKKQIPIKEFADHEMAHKFQDGHSNSGQQHYDYKQYGNGGSGRGGSLF